MNAHEKAVAAAEALIVGHPMTYDFQRAYVQGVQAAVKAFKAALAENKESPARGEIQKND
jgi:hypothetical protein